MNDRRPYAVIRILELGHGIHDLPELDTSYFRSFAVRLDPYESRPPIDRSANTLVLVVEGSVTIVLCGAIRATTELGEGDSTVTNPPAVEVLQAGEDGASLLAMVSRS